ncbi:MAG: DUF368 domain-containing protein [Corynebacterium sp.]|nr:DUF368 domain-containing protein [Corynebacterium sp.]
MHYILNFLRGGLIGAAELVPGISGGTVALTIGIYERALHNGNYLFKGRFHKVEWLFLACVAAGMFTAVFSLSSLLHGFVDNEVSASRALFFGMVAVSIIVPISMMNSPQLRTKSNWAVAAIAAIVIFTVTSFTSEPIMDPPLIVVFFAAAFAICALILPGVSGSLILLTFGMYHFIIAAVSQKDLVVIAVFAIGALSGLAAFIRVLEFLLDKHRGPTLAAMSGSMLGSLRALWPWGEIQDASSSVIIGLMLLGAAIVGFFIVIDARIAKQTRLGTQTSHRE